jgi:hypothetical protein
MGTAADILDVYIPIEVNATVDDHVVVGGILVGPGGWPGLWQRVLGQARPLYV